MGRGAVVSAERGSETKGKAVPVDRGGLTGGGGTTAAMSLDKVGGTGGGGTVVSVDRGGKTVVSGDRGSGAGEGRREGGSADPKDAGPGLEGLRLGLGLG